MIQRTHRSSARSAPASGLRRDFAPHGSLDSDSRLQARWPVGRRQDVGRFARDGMACHPGPALALRDSEPLTLNPLRPPVVVEISRRDFSLPPRHEAAIGFRRSFAEPLSASVSIPDRPEARRWLALTLNRSREFWNSWFDSARHD